MEYKTAIIKQSGGIISKNGSYSEIEEFILKHMGNIKSCRTTPRGNPNKFVEELCMSNY